ncbi:TIM barrel protein [Paenibacillus spiritus]|uniref:TIM barrel protein n=1 Tax=Paenibacillus spiritus TaxID=2496557 RepID=A0A5J5GAA0_9BACL|nr:MULTISPECIES: TIM barrel protein [Paenibacillus]KAA9004901.1 TIM barrel protein [Paenibacillus spiritus]
MKISFNVETLFSGMPIEEAMRTLHRNGIRTLEFWSWKDKDIARVRQLRDELDMDIASIVVTPESLLDPSRRDALRDAVKGTAEAARELGCRRMVHTAGPAVPGVRPEDTRKRLIEGVEACLPILEEYEVITALEPLNNRIDRELADGCLTTSEEAFAIAEAVQHPLVKVCYDMYHVQIMEGNVLQRLQNRISLVGHIQGAGVPGRHELYLGELNYDYIFDAIKQMDYNGYVGVEYFPLHDPIEDLKQIHAKHHTG